MAIDQVLAAGDPNPGGVAGLAWRSVRAAFGAMPMVFLGAAGVLAAAQLLQKYLGAAIISAGVFGGPVDFALLKGWAVTLLFEAMRCVAFALLTVPVCRLILREETEAPRLFSARTLRMAAWLFAYRLLWLVAFLPAQFWRVEALRLGYDVVESAFASSIFNIVTQIALFHVWVRIGLVYPAVSLDAPGGGAFARMREAWSLSQERQWRMFWSAIIAFLPLYVVSVALAVAGFLFTARGAPETGEGIRWGTMVATNVTGIAGAALAAATLSWNYRLLTGQPHDLTAETFA